MKAMVRVTGFALGIAALAAVLFTASRSDAQRLSEMRQLVEMRCQACHTMRRIETSSKTAEAWRETIQVMIQEGAEVEESEVPLLVEYLSREHGPLPEGPGKQILLNTCTMCHDLRRIRIGRRSAEEWEETLLAMLNEGAPLPDAQFPLIHEYLARHFGID